jgi:hypothetical protein
MISFGTLCRSYTEHASSHAQHIILAHDDFPVSDITSFESDRSFTRIGPEISSTRKKKWYRPLQ